MRFSPFFHRYFDLRKLGKQLGPGRYLDCSTLSFCAVLPKTIFFEVLSDVSYSIPFLTLSTCRI